MGHTLSWAACRRAALSALLLAAAVGLGGCLSFRGVTAAGSIGQMVGARSVSATLLPFYCDAENILASPRDTCPRLQMEAREREIVTYSQGLAKYASALRGLAEFNDQRVGDPISRAAYSLTRVANDTAPLALDPTAQGISSAALNLGAILTQEWRRHKLKKMIVLAHPHVLSVCDGLQKRAALLSEPLRFMAKQGVKERRRALAELDRAATTAAEHQERQAQQLALLQFEFLLQQGYENLQQYLKALIAFRQAHVILYESITVKKSLSDNDEEIYELLKKDLPPELK